MGVASVSKTKRLANERSKLKAPNPFFSTTKAGFIFSGGQAIPYSHRIRPPFFFFFSASDTRAYDFVAIPQSFCRDNRANLAKIDLLQ